MKNKTLAYVGLGGILLLLFGVFAMGGMGRMNGKSVSNKYQPAKSNSEDLNYYRSEEIPEDCRLPDYEEDIDKWRKHLSHHENTLYCLDYYKNDGDIK